MTIKQWATTYWWACMLMMVALILFMAAFIKCCAVHTPSSNPKKRPALRITDTLRRPADTLRRKRHRSNSHGHSSSSSSRDNRVHNQQSQPLTPSVTTNLTSNASSCPSMSVPGVLQMQMNANPHAPPTLMVSLPPETRPEPPPPYSGPRPTAPSALLAGPSHGYGEGRGHYNRRGQQTSGKQVASTSSHGSQSARDGDRSGSNRRNGIELKATRR